VHWDFDYYVEIVWQTFTGWNFLKAHNGILTVCTCVRLVYKERGDSTTTISQHSRQESGLTRLVRASDRRAIFQVDIRSDYRVRWVWFSSGEVYLLLGQGC